MNPNIDFVAQIRRKKGTIILLGILVSASSFLLLVSLQKNFKVRTDYLVVQNSQNTTDTYALAKSAEYMGRILSEGMRSELFINEVIKTGKVNAEFLPFERKQKIKTWENMVGISQDADLGIISVTVFNDNQRDAVKISEAISEVITTKNNLFRGEGQNIEVRILSGPVMEKNPSMDNIFAAVAGGFIFGIMLSLVWIFLRSGNGNAPEKQNPTIAHKEYSPAIPSMNNPTQKPNYTKIYEDESYIESIRNFEG